MKCASREPKSCTNKHINKPQELLILLIPILSIQKHPWVPNPKGNYEMFHLFSSFHFPNKTTRQKKLNFKNFTQQTWMPIQKKSQQKTLCNKFINHKNNQLTKQPRNKPHQMSNYNIRCSFTIPTKTTKCKQFSNSLATFSFNSN